MTFIKHTIKNENGHEVLYLYIKPNAFSTEFASEFDSPAEKEKISRDVQNYIKQRKIRFNGKYVKILASTMLLGTFLIGCSTKNSNQSTSPSNSSNTIISSSSLSTSEGHILTDEERVTLAKDELSLENLDILIEDFTLPLAGEHNTIITWESTNPAIAIIDDIAHVTRLDDNDSDGDLIATIIYNDYSLTKTFFTRVLMNETAPWADDTEFTQGLHFVFNETDNTFSIVGTDFEYYYDGDLIIPSVYNGFPVRRIGSLEITITGKLRLGANITSIDSVNFLIAGDIEVSPYNPVFSVKEHSLFKGTILVRYFGGNPNYQVPEGTTSLGDHAFAELGFINNLGLPTSLTTIGNWVFMNCNLSDFVLPKTVTSFGAGAFVNTSISELTVPDTMEHIPNFAFEGSNLTSITLPNGLKSIGYNSFFATPIKALNLPNTLEVIEDMAFYNCSIIAITIPDATTTIKSFAFMGSALQSIYIGSGVTTVGNNIFTDTGSLSSITISPKNKALSVSNGNILFNKNKTILYSYPYQRTSAYTVPSTVTTIGNSAFIYSQASSITLSEGLKVIEENAFANMNIKTISIPSTVEEIKRQAFYATMLTTIHINRSASMGITVLNQSVFMYNTLQNLYLPDAESLQAYKAASFWSNYAPKMLVI